jgi:hypothetical protein
MRRAVFEVGAAVAAALVALAVTTLAGMTSGLWKVFIIAASAVLALAAAAWASSQTNSVRRVIRVGSRQTAKGNIRLENISADPAEADVEIGLKNKSGKDITVKGVNVQGKPPGTP